MKTIDCRAITLPAPARYTLLVVGVDAVVVNQGGADEFLEMAESHGLRPCWSASRLRNLVTVTDDRPLRQH